MVKRFLLYDKLTIYMITNYYVILHTDLNLPDASDACGGARRSHHHHSGLSHFRVMTRAVSQLSTVTVTGIMTRIILALACSRPPGTVPRPRGPITVTGRDGRVTGGHGHGSLAALRLSPAAALAQGRASPCRLPGLRVSTLAESGELQVHRNSFRAWPRAGSP